MVSWTNSEWEGAFLPEIKKHYRHGKPPGRPHHPEELPEHIIIVAVSQLTDDEIEELDDEVALETNLDLEQMVRLGDGGIPYLVIQRWVGESEDTGYRFLVNADEQPDEDDLKRMLAEYYKGA